MPVANENEQVDGTNVNTPLIPESSDRPLSNSGEPTTSAEAKQVEHPEEFEAEVKVVQTLPNEYRFIQQRIPPKNSLLRYTLPALLLGFQVVFIILFAFFGKYTVNKPSDSVNEQEARKYPSKFSILIYKYNWSFINILITFKCSKICISLLCLGSDF